jgi:WD40 repeat protein/uncharacterized caspase-like protein
MAGHAESVYGVVFSPDGRSIASGAWDGTVRLWDVAGERLPRTLTAHQGSTGGYINAVAFFADGRTIASATYIGSITLWDVATGRIVRTMKITDDPNTMIGAFAINALACSPDGRTIASASNDKLVRLWDRTTGRLLRTLTGHEDPAMTVAFSPDGHTVVSGSADATLKLWDVASGRELRTIPSQGGGVLGVVFSPDGRTIASSSSRGLKLWDAASGRELNKLDAISPGSGNSSRRMVAFSPDGRTIAYSLGLVLHVWDPASENDVKAAVGDGWSGKEVGAVAFSPDGLVIAAGWGKEVQQWDSASGRPLLTLRLHSGAVKSITFASDGSTIASAGVDDTIRLWDATSGRALHTLQGHQQGQEDGQMQAVAFSPDGRTIVSGGFGEHHVSFWDAASGRILRTPSLGVNKYGVSEDTSVRGVAFAPDGHTVVSTGLSKLSIWDTTGRALRTFNLGNVAFVDAVAFSPDGRTIAWGADWGNLQLWDAATGRALRKFTGHEAPVEAVAFSPDGRLLASGSKDNTVRLWDTASGRLLHTLFGHSSGINGVAFSPDGRSLISGSADSTIRRWNLAGELLAISVVGSETDWLTLTPEGFFDTSGKGTEAISVVRGLNAWSIDQLYQSLYRPDLVREKLAGDPRGLVREAAARLDLTRVISSGSAPDVGLTLPARGLGVADSFVAVEAGITDRGGGIGRIEWRVNGITAGVDNPASSTPGQALRLTRRLALDPGDNDIAVIAYNGANLVASVPSHVSVATAQPTTSTPGVTPIPSPAPSASSAATAKPRLFTLVAGVNDYADKRIKLAFAVSDAKDVARAFKDAAGSLYQSVDVKLLTDAEVTRDKLDAAFREIAGKAQPSDVFVLYLAGHGKTVDGRYYFVPQDFTVDGELTEKTINKSVLIRGISQDQLQRWFASVPARKSVILFDTCDSGTLTGDADETHQLERGAANDRLAQATGRSIITASGGSQEALEGYRGHGLFTYEMLDGLNRADGDSNGTIEVTELAAYVYAQVTELSQKVFKQRQAPQMKITANYPILKQTRVLQDEVIPVAEAKPTYQLKQSAQLQIQPNFGATVVRNLSPRTAVTILGSEGGWSLIASEGKPLGYVATRDLAPIE